MKRYRIFINHQYHSESDRFPAVGAYMHPKCIVFDATKKVWWWHDGTPYVITQVPKEVLAAALLLGIA